MRDPLLGRGGRLVTKGEEREKQGELRKKKRRGEKERGKLRKREKKSEEEKREIVAERILGETGEEGESLRVVFDY